MTSKSEITKGTKVNLSIRDWVYIIITVITFTSGAVFGYSKLLNRISQVEESKAEKTELHEKCIKDSINDCIVIEKLTEIQKDIRRLQRDK